MCDNADYFYKFIDDHLREFGFSELVKGGEIVDLIEGYAGKGYALSTEEELSKNVRTISISLSLSLSHKEQLIQISTKTGVILDRVYTFKAVRGMLEELNKNPSRFKGRKILFLHTGKRPRTTFSLFPSRLVIIKLSVFPLSYRWHT